MTPKRIRHLADFFYSSDSAADVPLRICCETGRYTGFDLDRDGFISLLVILTRSDDLKNDLAVFVEQQT
ncbi:MAG: hypothetical protein HPY65_18950 [Syntrophaceae bacterium]|nr:hypothetical protein [Syntrophaceae bacterium]